MAQNTKTWIWIILILAGALFIGGMYTQKQYPIFSVYSTTGSCDYFLSQNSLPSTSVAPFNWASGGGRCVTSMVSSGSGCSVTYTAGVCPTTTCTPSWQCTAWSTCASSTQTRTCIDTNVCGAANRIESQACTSGTTQSCLISDIDGNGKVGRTELGTAIDRWASNA